MHWFSTRSLFYRMSLLIIEWSVLEFLGLFLCPVVCPGLVLRTEIGSWWSNHSWGIIPQTQCWPLFPSAGSIPWHTSWVVGFMDCNMTILLTGYKLVPVGTSQFSNTEIGPFSSYQWQYRIPSPQLHWFIYFIWHLENGQTKIGSFEPTFQIKGT